MGAMTMTEAKVTGTTAVSEEAETAVPSITFVSGLPGFPEIRDFVLVRIGDAGSLFALTSLSEPDL
ncbi:MAG: FliW protein, partial [Micromonosporaceae bacterium]|nr:FliW protein [Micromonosporaceae bacterium]